MNRRGSVAALVLLAAVMLAPGAPAAAAPQPVGKCTTSSGVILAVDFSHWGGPLLRACGTTPTTGYQLLNQGGWKTAGTQHDGPAFVCRIGYSGYQGGTQYPTSATEKCVLTPPATAYWSYWHADPGQDSWSYSQLGAMGYHPKPGSVDLWTFGATATDGSQGRPRFSPDSVRARNTSPIGSPTPKPRPTTARPSASTARPSASAAAASTSAGPSAPAAMPSASVSETAAPTEDVPPIVDAAPTGAAAPQDPGTAVPLLVTAAIVLLLGTGAVVAVRRRRAAADD
ncbi:hypothetical protein Cs7R123_13370 [Catellatospora sp. TT07R-123]|uniref:hypothetical protein n=1 Tax=Catellatospora sp. TT07R-123 TaxID=2733863 RepID=UPI001B11CFA4|nr:hypothetical protein [Catellatospora sp. TT07R-123]GHJ43995.1 hypothetical protein Cs7R123_13370 [Catellatospora sp. TT07R-123]